jgi:hypothetical protein
MCQIESFKDAKCQMAHRRGGMRVELPFVASMHMGGDIDAFSAHSSHEGFIASPQSQCMCRLPKHRREEGERTQHDATI